MDKNEKVISLALRLGYVSVPDIIDQTGLGKKTVETGLELLRSKYGALNNEHMVSILAPKPPDLPPQFTSHDCVMIDAALSTDTAANLLNQVLGKQYCQDLKIAL